MKKLRTRVKFSAIPTKTEPLRVVRLSRETIVQAALGLLEEVGYHGLTTRRLAGKLGVKQPALYWHFPNKRELDDAMAAAMLSPGEWPGPATPGLRPEDWLAARAHAFRRSLLAHRDGAIIHAGTFPGPDLLSGLDSLVAALVDHGLTPEDGLRTLLAIGRYTVGWVLEEQAGAQRAGQRTMQPDAASPTLLRAQAVVQHLDPTANFDFGLRALIAGTMRHRRAYGAPPDGPPPSLKRPRCPTPVRPPNSSKRPSSH